MRYYCFEYSEYDQEKGYVTIRQLLSEELTAAFQITLSQEPVEVSLDEHYNFVSIHRCSKDMVFCAYAFGLMYDPYAEAYYLEISYEDENASGCYFYLLDERYIPLLTEEISFLP